MSRRKTHWRVLRFADILTKMYAVFSDGSNALSQMDGVSVLLSTCRRDRLDLALESFLLQQLRNIQLQYSLHNRKQLADAIAAPAMPSPSTHLDALFELAFQLPAYLEATDLTTTVELRAMTSDLSRDSLVSNTNSSIG
jgi:hypothetical protein